jgi:hypothetical protein
VIYSLCLQLGFPHPDYLYPFLSSSQVNDWLEFHKTHNIHFDRSDTFHSQLLAMFFNAHKPENHKALTPLDFVPWREQPELTPDELKRKLGFTSK